MISCGVIGSGWWGTEAHVPALVAHAKAELVAIHHHDPDTAQKLAKEFNVGRGCSSVEELLGIEELDAVVVSTPPFMHYGPAKAALERGLHVLIEKPMTVTLAEAHELVQLAEKQGVEFLIGCPWHYTAHSIEAQRLVQNGEIGRVKMICVWMMDHCLSLYRGLTWDEFIAHCPGENPNPLVKPGRGSYSDPKIAGGGQMYAQVSHPAAFLSYVTGREPVEVHAHLDNGDAEIDVYDVLNIKLDDGILVSMASTGATYKTKRNISVRIYGTEALIVMDLFAGTMTLERFDGSVQAYPDLSDEDVYPMHAPANNLVDAVAGDAPNRSPAALGYNAMQIIEAAYRSSETGRNMRIDGGTVSPC